jgi:hypothetical protein
VTSIDLENIGAVMDLTKDRVVRGELECVEAESERCSDELLLRGKNESSADDKGATDVNVCIEVILDVVPGAPPLVSCRVGCPGTFVAKLRLGV